MRWTIGSAALALVAITTISKARNMVDYLGEPLAGFALTVKDQDVWLIQSARSRSGGS